MAWRIDNLPWGWTLGSFAAAVAATMNHDGRASLLTSSVSLVLQVAEGRNVKILLQSDGEMIWETIKKNLILETFAVFCSLGVFPPTQGKREAGWFLQQLVWQRPLGLSRAPMDSRRCLRWLGVHSSPAWLSRGVQCTQLTNSRAPLVWSESDLNSDTLA